MGDLDAVWPFIALAGLIAASVAGVLLIADWYDEIRKVGPYLTWWWERLRRVSAWTAHAFDFVIPIRPQDGNPVRPNFALWVAANLGVVAVFHAVSWALAPGIALDAAAAANGLLALFNVLFLSSTYGALREGAEIMNGERRRDEGVLYKELSTARNLSIFGVAAVVALLQIAVVLQWLQQTQGVSLVTFKQSAGVAALDFLFTVVNAIPFVSVYTEASGVAALAAPAPGAGTWTYRILNMLGSVLIVSTVIAFVQQHNAFRALIANLLKGETSLLVERFKHAPSAIKSYVGAAFEDATDDDQRLQLIRMAVVLGSSYGFPARFVRSYGDLTRKVRSGGAVMIADFVAREGLDEDAFAGLVKATNKVYRDNTNFVSDEDRAPVGSILLAALQGEHAQARKDLGKVVRQIPIQVALQGLLAAPGVAQSAREQAAAMLITARARESYVPVLKGTKDFGNPKRAEVFAGLSEALHVSTGDWGPKNDKLIDSMYRIADAIRHNTGLSDAAKNGLRALQDAIRERQKKYKRAAPANQNVQLATAAK